MSKILYMFPGQGSQSVGMGRDLYEKYPAVRRMLDNFNSALDFDLLKVMFEGPQEVLNDTQYTQPALYSLSLAIYELLKEKGYSPDYLAGHSLGEYSAVAASGALDYIEGLELVARRGRLMAKASEKAPGLMAAVLFKNPEVEFPEVEKVVKELSAKGEIVIANYNGSFQVVISGEKELIKEAASLLAGRVKRVVPLSVSGAFHSPLMKPIAEEFAELLRKATFRKPSIPVFMNVDASLADAPESIREKLLLQLTSPVRWTELLKNAYIEGVREFVEVGPGRVLQGMVAKTLSGVVIKGYSSLL